MTAEERLALLGPDLVAMANESAANAPDFTQDQLNTLALLFSLDRDQHSGDAVA